MRPALLFVGSFMAETAAVRLGCFHVVNGVSGRMLEATASPMHTWRRQTNVRSCEQSWMPFMGKAHFRTEQCVHWRGSNLFFLHGNVRGVAALCLLWQCSSLEFAAANKANLPPASVDTAAACVQPCQKRFLSLVEVPRKDPDTPSRHHPKEVAAANTSYGSFMRR